MNDTNQNSYGDHVIEEQLRAERNALSDALGASLDELRKLRAELEDVKKRQASTPKPREEP